MGRAPKTFCTPGVYKRKIEIRVSLTIPYIITGLKLEYIRDYFLHLQQKIFDHYTKTIATKYPD